MQKDEHQVKNNIYPPSVSRTYRNTYHHQSRIKINLEEEEINGKPSAKLFENFITILQKSPYERIESEINLIVQYLNHTELIEKFKIEQDLITDTSLNQLMKICATYMKTRHLHAGDLVFKIDEIGDKFYIILRGSVSVLKTKESFEYLTITEYLKHLHDLKVSNEQYLFQQTIKENFDTLPILDVKHLENIHLYIFKHKCRKALIEESFEKFLHLFKKNSIYSLSDFNISMEELVHLYDIFKFHSTQAHMESKNPWVEYVSQRLNFSHKDIIKYDKFREMFKNKEKNKYSILKYHKFLYLYAGQFFGDMALNSKNKKRNATIMVEEETVLGYLEHEIYTKYIRNENLKIRTKECQFINECFFNFTIPSSSLDKYYANFTPHSYLRGFEIYKEKTKFTELFLIKQGEVELIFNGSVMDIFNHIKLIVNKLTNSFKENTTISYMVTEEDISYLKSLSSDMNLERLDYKSQEYLKGVNKKRTSYICLLPKKETFGLEEFFLENLFYFCSARVSSDVVKVVKIDPENLRSIITTEKMTSNYFGVKSVNKIISLIKRLNHIKNTLIERLVNENTEVDLLMKKIKQNNSVSNGIRKDILEKKFALPVKEAKLAEENKLQRIKVVQGKSVVNSHAQVDEDDSKNTIEEAANAKKLKTNNKVSSLKDLQIDENVIKSLKVSVKRFIDKSLHSHLNEQNIYNPSRNLSIDKELKKSDIIQINSKLKADKHRIHVKSCSSIIDHPVSLVNLLGEDYYGQNKSTHYHNSNSNNNTLYNIFNGSYLIPGIINPLYLPKIKRINKIKRLPKIAVINLKENDIQPSNLKNNNESFINNETKQLASDAMHNDSSGVYNSLEDNSPNYPSMASTRTPLHVIRSSRQIDIASIFANRELISFRSDEKKNPINNLKALHLNRKQQKLKIKKMRGDSISEQNIDDSNRH